MPTEAGLALLFPGQGAQHVGMLEPFRGAPGFAPACDAVSSLLGWDVRRLHVHGEQVLTANLNSSLLTVLCGVLALRRLTGGDAPFAVAGYSVGQWTALHAAGVIDESTLFGLVARRARLMDEALAAAPPSGMLAVIGVARPKVDAICAAAGSLHLLLAVSNDNAPAQLTLAGSEPGLEFATRELSLLRPRVLKHLPVAGAWHGELMAPVIAPLREILRSIEFLPARCPVIDNCSGDWLPLGDTEALTGQLALQVARPVMWQQGVRRLIEAGVTRCLETGWGDVLTRFGFFIDRSVRHDAVAPLPRAQA